MRRDLDVSALQRAGDANEVTADLRDFLVAVEELGRDPVRLHGPEGQSFLAETAPLISNAGVSLGEFVRESERVARSELYGDEWFGLCVRRSRIQYVRDLYRDIAPVDWHGFFMDPYELDLVMRNKGREEGGVSPERIPLGTPTSHWWWWYPGREAPPEE